MITLAIDTASSHTSIALFEESNVKEELTWKSENNEAEKLMPAIEQMLNKNKLSYEPKVPIQKGIPKFIEWYKSYHKIT